MFYLKKEKTKTKQQTLLKPINIEGNTFSIFFCSGGKIGIATPFGDALQTFLYAREPQLQCDLS